MSKIGVICSPGGHLTQALSTLEAFDGQEVFLVVYDYPTLKEIQLDGVKKVYKLRLILGYSSWIAVGMTIIVSLFTFLKIFWIEKPSTLFSTGSEIAVPAFYIGKIFFRTNLIFMESLARVKDFSFTGKLLYPIVDLFLVRWPELVNKKIPKSAYWGRLL